MNGFQNFYKIELEDRASNGFELAMNPRVYVFLWRVSHYKGQHYFPLKSNGTKILTICATRCYWCLPQLSHCFRHCQTSTFSKSSASVPKQLSLCDDTMGTHLCLRLRLPSAWYGDMFQVVKITANLKVVEQGACLEWPKTIKWHCW